MVHDQSFPMSLQGNPFLDCQSEMEEKNQDSLDICSVKGNYLCSLEYLPTIWANDYLILDILVLEDVRAPKLYEEQTRYACVTETQAINLWEVRVGHYRLVNIDVFQDLRIYSCHPTSTISGPCSSKWRSFRETPTRTEKVSFQIQLEKV